MNLENTVKYHFPKSTQITDSPRATASDSLTGTDVMAAQGMVQARAQMGFAAFMGKMGVSSNDREKAIELLTSYGLTKCDKVAALRKLESNIKSAVVQILAIYAFEDYSRSAASKRTCDCCKGRKFIDAEVFTNKVHTPRIEKKFVKMSLHMGVEDIQPSAYEVHRSVREVNRIICHKCKGKGEISNACSDCKGRGKAISEEETRKQGVPVVANCKRCGGVGYSRLPSTEAFSAVCELTDAISLDTWKKSVKKFYDELITKFDIEEAWADSQLRAVTK